MICPICGRETDPGNYCQKCGAILSNLNPYPQYMTPPQPMQWPYLNPPSAYTPANLTFPYGAPAPPPVVHKRRMDLLYGRP
ncbi:MAG: hypothetical protein QW172_03585 [Candidatus Bathyarchaeia archaeon]